MVSSKVLRSYIVFAGRFGNNCWMSLWVLVRRFSEKHCMACKFLVYFFVLGSPGVILTEIHKRGGMDDEEYAKVSTMLSWTSRSPFLHKEQPPSFHGNLFITQINIESYEKRAWHNGARRKKKYFLRAILPLAIFTLIDLWGSEVTVRSLLRT